MFCFICFLFNLFYFLFFCSIFSLLSPSCPVIVFNQHPVLSFFFLLSILYPLSLSLFVLSHLFPLNFLFLFPLLPHFLSSNLFFDITLFFPSLSSLIFTFLPPSHFPSYSPFFHLFFPHFPPSILSSYFLTPLSFTSFLFSFLSLCLLLSLRLSHPLSPFHLHSLILSSVPLQMKWGGAAVRTLSPVSL